MQNVKVYLMLRTGRSCFECQWVDPVTGRKKTKSTKTKVRREAERFAGALQAQLNAGQYEETVNATWETVANRYKEEVLISLALKTQWKFQAVRNGINKIISPKLASSLSTGEISKYQSKLRDNGLAEATIKSHLGALRACLNWAFRIGLISKMPHFTMPKRVNKMKGRPITGEEFDRMLAAVEMPNTGDPVADAERGVFPASYAEPWRFMLKGLYLSALRLDEALRLTWNHSGFCIDFTGKHPRFRIEALNDKSTKARLLPMFPEFAELLNTVPKEQRKGKVFRPIVPNQLVEMRADTCSKAISRIGEMAKVLVAEYPPRPGEKEPRKKWASAHDLRRARLKYWSNKVKPPQLKELARHASIFTTMTFYVGEDLDDAENAVWDHPTNTTANNQTNSSENQCTSVGSNHQPSVP